MRHLLAMKEGEDVAGDSGIPHTAPVMATMSIMLNAAACGCLIYDRIVAMPDAYADVVVQILKRQARLSA